MTTNGARPARRELLPIPDVPRAGLVTDGDDPLDPDEPLRVATARR